MARSHKADKCEMPHCGAQAKPPQTFCFVSYAVHPKTKQKGMLLCPRHEHEAVERGY